MPIAAVVVIALAAPPAAARDLASVALNIIPSGQPGDVPPPPGADRQARMYDALTPLFDRVGNADLARTFKSERLTPSGPLRREPFPLSSVRIFRDSFDVPHIYSRTQLGLHLAAGWVLAADRGLLLEQARYNARVAAIDAPGLSAIDLITSLSSFRPSAATERVIDKQTLVLARAGARGRQLLRDIGLFVTGINAYYRATGNAADPWTRRDVYAVNALKGQFLGEGGGAEARSAELLDGLQDRLGERNGELVWNDLRRRLDPETQVSVAGNFPYAPLPTRRTGNVVIDAGSLDTDAQQALRAQASSRQQASNILIAAGARSATGHPLFVGGPHIGYFYPGLTLEMGLHAPGINTRGATSAPFPGYMLIGRGEDFAWTLTSAGADIIDQYVETLCDGSDTRYVFRGQCRDMGFFNAGTLTDAQGTRQITFNYTVHGPVIGYATVDGRRVAISRRRSSFGRDTLDQLFFQDLTYGRVDNVVDFMRSALRSPQTFNSFYADSQVAGMITTGLLPVRAPGVDSGLPTDGRGGFEWRGALRGAGHPHGIVRSGLLVNWNNKPARGFPAADDQFAYGSEQRNELLTRGLATRARHSLASVASAMNAAATQDLRVVLTLPKIAAVLQTGAAPSARAAQLLDILLRWRDRGGSRLDRDGDGKVDDPGAAIIDAAWDRIANAVMLPVVGPQADALTRLMPRFQPPPGGQFAGWHQYIDKDLRRLLGARVDGPLTARYCGLGSLDACRDALWAALEAAGDELAAAQGPDPEAWRADATRISFVPGLLPTTIAYTNRPSGIQQVISFFARERGR